MALTIGNSPLAPSPGGKFNFEIERLPRHPLYLEDGCGHELETWLKESLVQPSATGVSPKHNFALAAMPKECHAVVKAP